MRRIFILMAFLSVGLLGSAQVFNWANTFESGGKSSVYQTLVNSNGDIYVAGHFSGSTDFDPGDGTLILTSYGNTDAYVAKLNANGNILWAKQFGGTDADYIRGMDIDPSGNIYCTGSFSGTANFDPGSENAYYTSYGGEDMFIAELDEDGNYLWSGHMGSALDDHSVSIKTTVSGNIYISGYYMGVADVNPSDTAEFYLTTNNQATFVEKLNVDHELLWAKSMGGAAFDYCQSMCLDESENIYTCGMFGGIGDFDPGDGAFYLYAVGDRDIFISKLNSDGEFTWAISMGGPEGESAQSIAYDGDGNVYVCGNFKGTVDFDPDTLNYYMTSFGDNDIFVGKFDVNSNLLWVKQLGGELGDSPYALSLDNEDNVYVTGLFEGTADFNPGAENYYLTSLGDYDAFVSKINTNGDFVWAADMGGTLLDRGLAITNTDGNELFVGGLFTGLADFDPSDDTFYLNGTGEYNSFLTKLNTDLLGTPDFMGNEYSIYPNPTHSAIYIKFPASKPSVNIAVFNILGKMILERDYNEQNLLKLDLKGGKGLFLVQVTKMDGSVKTFKVIKQ
ncbi:MAG: T9SS type A sorting domain-containing protein [Chlorobi bacterium]|nr:T9SS type A sorting domain-containing protein [Chlorobiota bacterium]